MKKNIIIIAKSILFIGAFILIYSHFTISTCEYKLSKIAKYEKLSEPVDIQFMSEIQSTIPDTIKFEISVTDSVYKASCDSASIGKFEYIAKLLKNNSNMPKKMTVDYIVRLKNIILIKENSDALLADYKTDVHRLASRFPSKLVLINYKYKK